MDLSGIQEPMLQRPTRDIKASGAVSRKLSFDSPWNEDRGETSLHTACLFNRADTVRSLLAQPGIDPNAQSKQGWTALNKACSLGHVECVEALLALPVRKNSSDEVSKGLSSQPTTIGIDLTLSPELKQTPLHSALAGDYLQIACLLIEKGGVDLLSEMDAMGIPPLLKCVTDISRELMTQYACRQQVKEGQELAAAEKQTRIARAASYKRPRRRPFPSEFYKQQKMRKIRRKRKNIRRAQMASELGSLAGSSLYRKVYASKRSMVETSSSRSVSPPQTEGSISPPKPYVTLSKPTYVFSTLSPTEIEQLATSVISGMVAEGSMLALLQSLQGRDGKIPRGSSKDYDRLWAIARGQVSYDQRLWEVYELPYEKLSAILKPLTACVVDKFLSYKKHQFDCLPIICERLEAAYELNTSDLLMLDGEKWTAMR